MKPAHDDTQPSRSCARHDNGSSPLEGFRRRRTSGPFAFRSTCSSSIVRSVWSRLWSFRVQNGVAPGRANGRHAHRERTGAGWPLATHGTVSELPAYFFLIWSVTVVLCLRLPLVPVRERVLLPALLLRLACTVSVEVLEVLLGLKLAVAPAGRPLRVSVTLPLKPPLALTVIA